MDDSIKALLEMYPFLSFGTLQERPYLGVVQNCDAQLISMYILTDIPTEVARKAFLEAAFDWWWGSNRQIPINIFLKERFRPYRLFLKHFSRKDFNLEAGPVVSLQETIARRVRKRQITLIRRL
jgi:hypothetical protein